MEDRYVGWKEWAQCQVTLAVLDHRVGHMQERVKTLEDSVSTLEAVPLTHPKIPTPIDWKWLIHIGLIIAVIAFLLLANINEKMAEEILKTVQAIIKR